MAWSELSRIVVAIAVGYLLGSVLPAELLARARGIDIRAVGDSNPGTINAIRELGWVPGMVTGVYDVCVGVVAIWLAQAIGVAEAPALLAGIAAVVGHRFPAFRGLRGGGQGMAASAGLLVYGVALAFLRGSLTAAGVALLVAVALGTFALTRSDKLVALVMLPIVPVLLVLGRTGVPLFAFTALVAGHIWVTQALAMRTRMTLPGVTPASGHPNE